MNEKNEEMYQKLLKKNNEMYQKLLKIFPIKIDELNMEIKLDVYRGKHHGSIETENIWWNKLKFNDYNGYDSINLMYFYINEEQKNIAKNKVISKGTQKEKKPHIDAKTGNIHPGKEYVEKHSGNYDKVKQLVLCAAGGNDLGPKLPANILEDENEDELYLFSSIHKSCYYPRIDGKEFEEGKDWRQDLLRQVWNELEKAGLTERD